jgi:ATP-dependent Clp protease adaptor protein ClpS
MRRSGKHGKIRFFAFFQLSRCWETLYDTFPLFLNFIISSLFPETETLPEVETEEQVELLRPWKVLVLNDPVNLMSYVVMVFRKVFGYDETQATHHMKEVHELGRSVLWIGEREQAEGYVYQLHRWRLQASLEKDD